MKPLIYFKEHFKPSTLFLMRNWKSGEIKLMAFAILFSVMCITSVVFITEKIRKGIEQESGSLLGSDAGISSPTPIDPEILIKAKALNLKTTSTLSFLSMLVHGQELTLAEVKAVGNDYPLKGELRTSKELFSPDDVEKGIPEPGTVWLEMRVFPLLGVKINQHIMIGSAAFKVTRLLTAEPDRTLEGISFAPRAIINEGDVASTQIVQPGSRVTYKLLLAGEKTQLNKFDAQIKKILNPTQKYNESKNTRPVVFQALERIDTFLGVIFLINVSLAGIAVAMVARRFCQRQFDTVALLRCFGATHGWIRGQYLMSLGLMGILSGLLGTLVGFVLEHFLTGFIFKGSFLVSVKTSVLLPISIGLATVLTLLFGFALPPIIDLSKVPTMRILKKDLPMPEMKTSLMMFYALASVAGLIMIYTKSVELTAYIILITVIISGILISAIYSLLNLLNRIIKRLSLTQQLYIRNLSRRSTENTVQILAFSLVLGLMGTIFFVKNDLMQAWQNQTPIDAPNYFAVNLPPKDVPSFQNLLQNEQVKTAAIYPMIMGRLMAVNEDIVEMTAESSNKNRVLSRLLNLTWTAKLPLDNRVIEGAWFGEKSKDASISIEKGFSERLSIKLGDRLKFQIGDKTIAAPVSSIRTVEWDSFQPNFFVIFSPGVLEALPITYMTSFYLPLAKINLLKDLIHHFPMVNIIDTHMIILQLKSFLDHASLAAQYLWIFTIGISFVLLFSALNSTLDERKEEAGLLRILGVRDKQLKKILLAEFISIGGLSGLIAAVVASFVVYWLSHYKLNIPYHFNSIVFLIPIIGMLLVGIGGWMGVRKILLITPKKFLSEG